MAYDFSQFASWLKVHVKAKNEKSVLRTIAKLHRGESVSIGARTFSPLRGVRLTPDMDILTEELCDQARVWAPRGKKNDRADDDDALYDSSNGWLLHHPLRKLLKFKREVVEPERERREGRELANAQLLNMQILHADRLSSFHRREYNVRAHTASNAERMTASLPFLKACIRHARAHGYEWAYVEEFAFGNRQRCDIYLTCPTCCVVVESKTNNLLHGLGQVLHYDKLAMQDVAGYKTARTYRMVVLAKAPRPTELATAEEFDVHVWWPDESRPLPEFHVV